MHIDRPKDEALFASTLRPKDCDDHLRARRQDASSDIVACALHSQQQAVLDQQCGQNHSAAWNRLQPCRGRLVVLAAGGMVRLG